MNSFLNQMGFDPGYVVIGTLILVVILLIVTLIILVKYNHMKDAYESFMQGNDGRSLEKILTAVVNDNKRVKIQCKNNIDAIVSMRKSIKGSYKKIGLMKYDTFQGMSGKLSFSLALLDGEDNGFVLSSMHSQDGCYTYLKEIIHGKSHAVLSNEEREALNSALDYEISGIELSKEERYDSDQYNNADGVELEEVINPSMIQKKKRNGEKSDTSEKTSNPNQEKPEVESQSDLSLVEENGTPEIAAANAQNLEVKNKLGEEEADQLNTAKLNAVFNIENGNEGQKYSDSDSDDDFDLLESVELDSLND